MADIKDSASKPAVTSDASASSDHDPAPAYPEVGGTIARPDGWMYKGFKIFGVELWYASPKVQLFMVAMVCFLCPGMYNALTGMGGAGQLDTHVQNNASIALYSVFAVVGFLSGSFANKVGIKITLGIGGIGYCVYAASYLCYNHTKNEGFVVFSGALLGFCAGLLWAAQGAVMMSYPPEESKGRYISWFWIIFNMGAVIGALIPLGQNIHTTSNGTVSDGTYVAFIILMVLGAILSSMLCNADKVIREDGSKVVLMKNPTWQSELKGLWECLYLQPWVIALFPMFFASNIFYTYQQNDINAAHFNVRTRALNNLLYWAAQIFAAVIFGYVIDIKYFRRSVRAKASFATLFSLTFIIWGGGYKYQSQQVTREVAAEDWYVAQTMDWTDSAFIGPMFLYIFYGAYDAVWQTAVYWYMGALSNSSRKTANMAGFYKGIQSAGAAAFWAMDSKKLPFDTMFYSTWGVCAGALLIAAPVIILKIKDTTELEADLEFSDEKVEDVAGGALAERRVYGEVGV